MIARTSALVDIGSAGPRTTSISTPLTPPNRNRKNECGNEDHHKKGEQPPPIAGSEGPAAAKHRNRPDAFGARDRSAHQHSHHHEADQRDIKEHARSSPPAKGARLSRAAARRGLQG